MDVLKAATMLSVVGLAPALLLLVILLVEVRPLDHYCYFANFPSYRGLPSVFLITSSPNTNHSQRLKG